MTNINIIGTVSNIEIPENNNTGLFYPFFFIRQNKEKHYYNFVYAVGKSKETGVEIIIRFSLFNKWSRTFNLPSFFSENDFLEIK